MTEQDQPSETRSTAHTTLLFPFVTNTAGFDTAITITNASAEPFGSKPLAGICRINYFGHLVDGGPAPPVQTSSHIRPGSQLVFGLNSGGMGIAPSQGFQGYLVVECFFFDAHGFAMIADLGMERIATGYLAQVIPSRP
ncbi:MAG: hypothetical protein Q8N47_24675 [Bryobacterales bacterium]|nr:hypothetical protein [Bryobacterales bacterium]